MNRTIINITEEPIPSLDFITQQVQDDGAGAISTFSGTTRNTFQGKRVIQLEYQAYEGMTYKVLNSIVNESRQRWQIQHIAIYHRTGIVPVGYTSVVVATSSVHRGDAIHATQYLIDELKARCPIWKKEVYEDGSEWKGSCNGCQSNMNYLDS
ncbi:Molybdopterin biosynthesis MoaE [Halteromyces radiatus]|uniref:Molybdopterin biosynthesis MoaE n=1 Tax=Halteromyces radiatus TaxID=101107 RepID=UPI00222069A3|nr:Molybdopterin biosynthesis MoaE [Halteromyces radiatus]KAI8086393.1 Molybdopterin biosynthesis MoaE [Halteromyces radiatus]